MKIRRSLFVALLACFALLLIFFFGRDRVSEPSLNDYRKIVALSKDVGSRSHVYIEGLRPSWAGPGDYVYPQDIIKNGDFGFELTRYFALGC